MGKVLQLIDASINRYGAETENVRVCVCSGQVAVCVSRVLRGRRQGRGIVADWFKEFPLGPAHGGHV